jgi:hypothetical protein
VKARVSYGEIRALGEFEFSYEFLAVSYKFLAASKGGLRKQTRNLCF